MKNDYGQWVAAARRRAIVRLMDGREAILMHVSKAARSCRINCAGRHYMCWIEDIALVQSPEGNWMHLEHWPPVDLDTYPGVYVTSNATAKTSRQWLQVIPNPKALHPSFSHPTNLPPPPPIRGAVTPVE